MNKRLKFIISLVLTLTIALSCLCFPAASFAHDVETTTTAMLLINLDTHTTVFSEGPDNLWYTGSLVNLMTYLVAYNNIPAPDEVTFKVEGSFIKALPYSDGCLDRYKGETLTARDLMAIALLTSGSDADFALADLASDGSREDFVKQMNSKAAELGCENTIYISPGFSDSNAQHTTCRDVYRVYMAARETDIFQKVMADRAYTPSGMEEGDATAVTDASIIRENSPFYFRYANDAKYSYSKETSANLAVTTTYRGKSYFFAGLLGKNESERNIFADARKLTTWAYLNLTDRKVISAENAIAPVQIDAGWGHYTLELYAFNSAYKTLPMDFDEELLSYNVDVPGDVSLPLFRGQSVGEAKVTYADEEIDDVDLIVTSNEGVDLLSDFARFGCYVLDQLMIAEPVFDADLPAFSPDVDTEDLDASLVEAEE